jgi:hypothetical protein
LRVAGIGDLKGAGSSEMVLRNARNGDFWLYDYDANTNSFTRALVGSVGFNLQVAGFGDLKGTGKSEMVLRNSSTGDFWLYNYDDNTNSLTGALVGAVGLN